MHRDALQRVAAVGVLHGEDKCFGMTYHCEQNIWCCKPHTPENTYRDNTNIVDGWKKVAEIRAF